MDASREGFYKNARSDGKGPLEGVRVLEMASTIAGPRCGNLFADYGADVVRIEMPGAPDITRMLPPMLDTDPPDGYLHATLNRNKRAINLDLHKPEGTELFKKLILRSDVFVENHRKGALAKYGCGYEDIREVKPGIIYVSITGYGQFGPYSHRRGYDMAGQAYSGIMYLNTHGEDGVPLRSPIYLSDELAGLHAAFAAMAALRHRDQTGEGQHIDVSLLDATVDSSTGIHTQAANGYPVMRWGNSVSFAVPANLYKCRDGYIYAGVLLDSQWGRLAELIGRPELAEDPEYNQILCRLGRREEIDQMLAEWCAERTQAEAVAALDKHQIPGGPVLSPEQALEDPHLQERGCFDRVTYPDGTEVTMPAAPAKLSRTPLRHRSAAPVPGADTDAVLEELGIGEAERQSLREKGVI